MFIEANSKGFYIIQRKCHKFYEKAEKKTRDNKALIKGKKVRTCKVKEENDYPA